MVAVIECILNQNARDESAASFPAMNKQIVGLCDEYGIGIMQMPCPEISYLGFERRREKGQSIHDALDTPDGRSCCCKLSIDIADRIATYRNQGYEIVAILGGNPQSPGCAVHLEDGNLLPASGVFMQELQKELRSRSVEIPFRGIRDSNAKILAEDIEWVRNTFSGSRQSD
jgi:predicted secreted protein